MLGEPIPERYRRGQPGAAGSRACAPPPPDPATWKDFAWTGICGVLGFAISLAAIVLWAVVLGLVTLPAWWWSLPEPVEFGLFEVDSLGLAFAVAGGGLLLTPVCGWIVRGLTHAWSWR